ncbi:MAG: hypothetical protein U0575_08970 [Phycisphaerales bacterium]|jgi:hypothetical protein
MTGSTQLGDVDANDGAQTLVASNGVTPAFAGEMAFTKSMINDSGTNSMILACNLPAFAHLSPGWMFGTTLAAPCEG